MFITSYYFAMFTTSVTPRQNEKLWGGVLLLCCQLDDKVLPTTDVVLSKWLPWRRRATKFYPTSHTFDNALFTNRIFFERYKQLEHDLNVFDVYSFRSEIIKNITMDRCHFNGCRWCDSIVSVSSARASFVGRYFSPSCPRSVQKWTRTLTPNWNRTSLRTWNTFHREKYVFCLRSTSSWIILVSLTIVVCSGRNCSAIPHWPSTIIRQLNTNKTTYALQSKRYLYTDFYKSKSNCYLIALVNNQFDMVFYSYSSENITDDIDIETVDNDVKMLTYRPEIKAKSMEPYRNSKVPRDPETWEDNINKYVWNFELLIVLFFYCDSITI